MADLKQINKITFDGNKNIVIQDVENTNITINQDNQEELEAFFTKFSDRLEEFETVLIDSQSRYANLQQSLSNFMKPKKTVYVVGTGAFSIPPEVLQAAQMVGQLLGEMDYNLIVGGWEGVDYVAAESFANVINQTPIALSAKLTQIVARSKQPIFSGGDIVEVKDGDMEWVEPLKRASVLIMIGGLGGTYETFKHAEREKKIVLPLAFTGGDAQQVYNTILQNPTRFPQLHQHLELFKSLGQSSDFTVDKLRSLLELFVR